MNEVIGQVVVDSIGVGAGATLTYFIGKCFVDPNGMDYISVKAIPTFMSYFVLSDFSFRLGSFMTEKSSSKNKT